LRQGDLLSAPATTRCCIDELKGRPSSRPFVCAVFAAMRFIARSQNKLDGTGDPAEHRPSPVVVGAGNTDT
jgi:hypothetical protein